MDGSAGTVRRDIAGSLVEVRAAACRVSTPHDRLISTVLMCNAKGGDRSD